MLSPPRYATRRRPERPTTGAHAALVAELLGVTLQPWQRHALDVAGELDESGHHAYSTVTLSVGRRAGKSLAAFARLVATIIAARRQFAYYTAQNGQAASTRFRNDWVPTVSASPAVLRDRLLTRLTNGTETLTDKTNASYLRIFSPIPTALHGDAADLIMFDEAWAFAAARGDDLEVAAFPLTATRDGAQVWITSAAGDNTSTWWGSWLDAGRAVADVDSGRGHCHIEWTADGVDPETFGDETVWIESHPGIRHPGNPTGVIGLEFLRAQWARDPGQFARAYLNVTDSTGTTSAPIDIDAWRLLAVPAPERDVTITLGIDVAVDQAAATVVAAFVDGDHCTVEVIEHRAGYSWVPATVAAMYDRWPVVAVAADVAGQSPAAVLSRPLERAGVTITALDLADVTAAAADMVAAVRAGTVHNVASPTLDAAIEGARRRLVGDGAWSWGRRDADVDVSALIAATFARWVHPDVHGVGNAGIH
jgi:phage terminase large subunit-like protein